jgi:hypothetical protein
MQSVAYIRKYPQRSRLGVVASGTRSEGTDGKSRKKQAALEGLASALGVTDSGNKNVAASRRGWQQLRAA